MHDGSFAPSLQWMTAESLESQCPRSLRVFIQKDIDLEDAQKQLMLTSPPGVSLPDNTILIDPFPEASPITFQYTFSHRRVKTQYVKWVFVKGMLMPMQIVKKICALVQYMYIQCLFSLI